MRINKEFAELLAGRLVNNAIQIEEAAIESEKRRLLPRILDHLYGDKRPEIESLSAPWVTRQSQISFGFRDGNIYGEILFKFDEELILPGASWNTIWLDLSERPDLLADLDALCKRTHAARQTGYRMREELKTNIMAAKTVKKLVELWPEAAEDIVRVAERFATPATEVPLNAILRRYQASLPAPAEIIEVAA